jgi:hypothetical protein
MAKTVKKYNSIISSVDSQQDVVVLVLTASREVEGERVPIVASQKDAAMHAAKSVLQCLGADVGAFSSSLVVPAVELAEGETLGAKVDIRLVKNTAQPEA